ncbi:MAG: DUF4097 domain-containing protein [Bacteroidetes bacterium]|nr:DUF4097 domain-containing protein [Bacteroidota bacterium]
MNNLKSKFSFVLAAVVIVVFSFSSLNAQKRIIVEKTFNVSAGQQLKVEAEGCDLKVDTWNKNIVEVKVYGNSRAEDKLDFEFEQTSDGVEVYAEKRGGFFGSWFSSIQCRIEVMVPEKFDAYVKTSGGDILLDNLEGEIEVKTSGGDIDLKNTIGSLYAGTSGGDVLANNHKGDSRLSTSGGDIKARDLVGDVKASTSGGDIELFVKNAKVEAHTSGGDIDVDLAGPNKGIELGTSGGDINLTVPKDIKGDFDLKASGGRVYCDLDATKVYRDSKRNFEAEINGGGERVYCKTSGGDVEVK